MLKDLLQSLADGAASSSGVPDSCVQRFLLSESAHDPALSSSLDSLVQSLPLEQRVRLLHPLRSLAHADVLPRTDTRVWLWPHLLKPVLSHSALSRQYSSLLRDVSVWAWDSDADSVFTGTEADVVTATLVHPSPALLSTALLLIHSRPLSFFHWAVDFLSSSPHLRLPLLQLLIRVLRFKPALSVHALPSNLLLLLAHIPILETNSLPALSSALVLLSIIIPRIPNHLPPFLPILFSSYLSLVYDDPSDTNNTNSNNPATPLTASRLEILDKYVPFPQNTKPDFPSSSASPSASAPDTAPSPSFSPLVDKYFSLLYGLVPLNLLSFLRHPHQFFSNLQHPLYLPHHLKDPDPTNVQNSVASHFSVHLLHPNFLKYETASQELNDKNRWLKYDDPAAGIAAECEQLYVRSSNSNFLPQQQAYNTSAAVASSDSNAFFDASLPKRRRPIPSTLFAYAPSPTPPIVSPQTIQTTSPPASPTPSIPSTSTSTTTTTTTEINAPPTFMYDDDILPPAQIYSGYNTPINSESAPNSNQSSAFSSLTSSLSSEHFSNFTPTPSHPLQRPLTPQQLPPHQLPPPPPPAASAQVSTSALGFINESIPSSSSASLVSDSDQSSTTSNYIATTAATESPSSSSPATPTPKSRHLVSSSTLKSTPTTSPDTHHSIVASNTTTITAADGGDNAETSTATTTASSSLKDQLIARLEHDNLVLKNSLVYEQHLRSMHNQRLGSMHREHVSQSREEAERQTLYIQYRSLQTQHAKNLQNLEQVRSEAATSKALHVKYYSDLGAKLKVLKDEKRSWNQRKERYEQELGEAKKVVEDKQSKLVQAENRIFELEAQAAVDAPKLEINQSLKRKVKELTAAFLDWDNEWDKYDQLKQTVKLLMSELNKTKLQVEAFQGAKARAMDIQYIKDNEVQQLQATIRKMQKQYESLEMFVEKLYPSSDYGTHRTASSVATISPVVEEQHQQQRQQQQLEETQSEEQSKHSSLLTSSSFNLSMSSYHHPMFLEEYEILQNRYREAKYRMTMLEEQVLDLQEQLMHMNVDDHHHQDSEPQRENVDGNADDTANDYKEEGDIVVESEFGVQGYDTSPQETREQPHQQSDDNKNVAKEDEAEDEEDEDEDEDEDAAYKMDAF